MDPDYADPFRADVAQPTDLGAQRVEWRGMAHVQWVEEHAGRDAQRSQPSRNRLAFMTGMLGVTPAWENDHVGQRLDPCR